jgi:hypothetical protein
MRRMTSCSADAAADWTNPLAGAARDSCTTMVQGVMGLAAANRRRDAKKLVAKTILAVEPGEVHDVSRTMYRYINHPLTC